MTPLLYQGVEGVADLSESHKGMKGTGFSPYIQNPKTCGALAPEGIISAGGDDPKLREECGVMAVDGHPEAARQVYLGLYALQHRGQESAGIATANGHNLSNIKGMGLVSEIFTEDILAKLPGDLSIGHTR